MRYWNNLSFSTIRLIKIRYNKTAIYIMIIRGNGKDFIILCLLRGWVSCIVLVLVLQVRHGKNVVTVCLNNAGHFLNIADHCRFMLELGLGLGLGFGLG